ncbi:MAG TPA: TonB family protein [Thermoanaerobaculia bacterium]|nr:TonB family protein [Thermoanaerobaculia bacterium]HUM29992.1 TonB family protein [Thermoanaerobaculia bacterium]HXK68319.1 TonB family protein [Thermoanaerobaculia bacterium]
MKINGLQFWLFFFLLMFLTACATRKPAPETIPPEPAPAPLSVEPVVEPEFLRVFVPHANIRSGPGTDTERVAQVERWDRLQILEKRSSWFKVRLADGQEGWVYSDLVVQDRPCLPDREKPELIEEPPVSFLDGQPKGTIVIQASVNTEGEVTEVSVLENTTGDDALGEIALQEARQMKFLPPVRDCEPQPFTYTYRRTF